MPRKKKLLTAKVFKYLTVTLILYAVVAGAINLQQWTLEFSNAPAAGSCGSLGGNYCSQSGSCPGSNFTNLGTTYDCKPCCKSKSCGVLAGSGAYCSTTTSCPTGYTNKGKTYDCNSCCQKITTACSCGTWQNGACGANGGCAVGSRKQTRSCTPSGCNTQSRCVVDSTCSSCSCGAWQNGACGANGGCAAGYRRQTRTCSPSGCQSSSQCVLDSSCSIFPITRNTINGTIKMVKTGTTTYTTSGTTVDVTASNPHDDLRRHIFCDAVGIDRVTCDGCGSHWDGFADGMMESRNFFGTVAEICSHHTRQDDIEKCLAQYFGTNYDYIGSLVDQMDRDMSDFESCVGE